MENGAATTEIIVTLFLALFLLKWAVETGLAGINLVHTLAAPDKPPAPLAAHIDGETLRRSRSYTALRLRFGLVRGALRVVLLPLLLFSGLLPRLEQLLGGAGLGGAHLFVAYLAGLGAAFALAGLPLGLYGTFVIESRYGFNRSTLGSWLIDRVKGYGLGAALGLPFLYGVYFFMENSGRWWWLWLFGFIAAVQLVMVWLYPALLAPLFNKFTPLEEGELMERVRALAHKAGFRTGGIFVMDASRRSGHSNAYFTGLLRPRIVLFDTLLDKMSPDESLAVLAHEIGHYRKRHIHMGLLLGLAELLGLLFVLSLLVDWQPFFTAFGFAAPSHHAALTLAALTGGAFTFYLAPLMSWRSRRKEYEADAYSVALLGLPEALKSALIGLNRENLANLEPHPWYSGYHYSHPTLLERMAAIDRLPASPTPG